MSFNIKTLIVFDTNSLRSTDAGEVAYSFFAFGKPYQVIEAFIVEKGLTADVHLAVPSWAIEEIKDQKRRQYDDDIAEYKKLVQRLSGLPHIGALDVPETEFDCSDYVQQRAKEYLDTKQVTLLEISEDLANNALQSMMTRVLKGQGYSAPFAHSGKYKDAGFKDNLVWESLMLYEGVANYDKIILVSKDGDFNKHCVEEFKAKWQKHFVIIQDENRVMAVLTEDYGNYIDYRKVYDYAQKDYFDDYLRDLLTPATYVEVEGESLKIENYSIRNHCARVETIADETGDFVSPVVISDIAIYTTKNGEKTEIPVSAKTVLSDSEYMEIEETTFEPGIR